jgi:hypothetical protein
MTKTTAEEFAAKLDTLPIDWGISNPKAKVIIYCDGSIRYKDHGVEVFLSCTPAVRERIKKAYHQSTKPRR